MELPDDILSVIRAYAAPLRPKEREANLIKEHVKEIQSIVRKHLLTMARNDPFQNENYLRTSHLVDSWTHYGRAKIARQPPGWLRMPLSPTPKYDTPIYRVLYRRSLKIY